MSAPAKYQEMADFFSEMSTDKLRILHGFGNPGKHTQLTLIVDILNGVLSGVDMFEVDYPLELAQ